MKGDKKLKSKQTAGLGGGKGTVPLPKEEKKNVKSDQGGNEGTVPLPQEEQANSSMEGGNILQSLIYLDVILEENARADRKRKAEAQEEKAVETPRRV